MRIILAAAGRTARHVVGDAAQLAGTPAVRLQPDRQAETFFPNNYQRLVDGLLTELRRQLPPEGVNVILEGVAEQWAAELDLSDLPVWERRMDAVVDYLNGQGYSARWEPGDGGVILHTANCPYHLATDSSVSLCEMDMRLIASLIGVVPRRLSQLKAGDETCSYHIPLVVA